MILSVDWDYFFPNIDGFDWGMNEDNKFLYELVWHTRYDNKNIITKEKAKDIKPTYNGKFWRDKVSDKFVRNIVITDSHKEIDYFIRPFETIYNFDAHHDAGYGHEDKLDCGNWALNENIEDYHVIYPFWRKESEEREPHILLNCHFEDEKDIFNAEDIDFVYVCRSSCWTPSWCDDHWLKFLEELKSVCPTAWENKLALDYALRARAFNAETAKAFDICSLKRKT